MNLNQGSVVAFKANTPFILAYQASVQIVKPSYSTEQLLMRWLHYCEVFQVVPKKHTITQCLLISKTLIQFSYNIKWQNWSKPLCGYCTLGLMTVQLDFFIYPTFLLSQHAIFFTWPWYFCPCTQTLLIILSFLPSHFKMLFSLVPRGSSSDEPSRCPLSLQNTTPVSLHWERLKHSSHSRISQ